MGQNTSASVVRRIHFLIFALGAVIMLALVAGALDHPSGPTGTPAKVTAR